MILINKFCYSIYLTNVFKKGKNNFPLFIMVLFILQNTLYPWLFFVLALLYPYYRSALCPSLWVVSEVISLIYFYIISSEFKIMSKLMLTHNEVPYMYPIYWFLLNTTSYCLPISQFLIPFPKDCKNYVLIF